MSEAIILLKFASRSRPHKFWNCLDNLREKFRYTGYKVLATLDTSDDSMNTEANHERLKDFPEVIPAWGTSNSKIHAINRDMEKGGTPGEDWQILINHSDDMWFDAFNSDNYIRSDMQSQFPDFDGVLQYWDGGTEARDFMTESIMGWRYYLRDNYIYYPGYESVRCDNEAVDVARRRGKYYSSPHRLFTHNHPAHGKGETDAQYMKTEHPHVHNRDTDLYVHREKANFNL